MPSAPDTVTDTARSRVHTPRYWQRLEGHEGIILPKPNQETEWNYSYFPVLFDGYKMDRNQVQARLAESDIYARKYFYPITNEAACYIKEYGGANVPISKHTSETVLTLPMYADLTVDDVDRICDVILKS